ncbi:four helix bundle protein [Flavisolibacter tropicus]|uniref:S23 ribosomal protein n=1 Tax=Flavisolibacter tropicus TaxID=1492898 RepID=A0A172TWK5_9BACT|nr:four helix bundle protein [Flavisolibacter tropicus]ANE51127.1 S23 ribosomal protein [Flavisolibacter tropicus]
MFLQLSHTKLDVFQVSKQLALECYKITKAFPSEEKFALVQQVRRAALSVHLNIAEGCSRTSAVERKRYFEISRGSVIEIHTALDIAECLGYCNQEQLSRLGKLIIQTFKILSGMMSSRN